MFAFNSHLSVINTKFCGVLICLLFIFCQFLDACLRKIILSYPPQIGVLPGELVFLQGGEGTSRSTGCNALFTHSTILVGKSGDNTSGLMYRTPSLSERNDGSQFHLPEMNRIRERRNQSQELLGKERWNLRDFRCQKGVVDIG